MKYKYILNNTVIFETNDANEFMMFLLRDGNEHIRHSVLRNLLEKDGYVCDMVTAQYVNGGKS
jgi:hypothetical protein